eukprot:m.165798 g.165798  ORF g.165798 m.165798 type:complete len:332 (-) comp31397_c0_seq1:246-1241(-)
MLFPLFSVVITTSLFQRGFADVGNCSDPAQYPVNPITHKSHPCADFCAGKCSFSPTSSQVIELIRMTPRNVSGIANKDTGDDAGDLFFTLTAAIKPAECESPNPPPWAGCFLNGDNIFIKSKVEVDGQWGIYQECNPASAPLPPSQANPGSFVCCGGLNCSGPPGPLQPSAKNSSDMCFCARTNQTVGVATVEDHFTTVPFMPAYLKETAALLGGNWYSTPADGECAPNQTVGQGCSWKVQEIVSVINQTCVKNNVYGAVEHNCPAAFESCAQPYNRSTPCYANVFFQAFLGNATLGCTQMPREALLAPWVKSFNGGCPPLTIDAGVLSSY